MLGTAGHVDHGKTALVKLLTGCDTDRLPEEKRRGMTIELGFAPCRLSDDTLVGIVDVPGHVDFIRNMAAGAHGMDGVIFVIAADDGVMPQTREHLQILTLLGVRRGLVALTKIDLIPPETRAALLAELRGFLAGTFLADEPICPISNITGEGFDGLYEAINTLATTCPQRTCTGLFRLWVERSFSIRGFGTVVSGIPTAGQVSVGDKLTLLPDGAEVRVRHLEVYGEEAQTGRSGECIAINLADIDAQAVGRGKLLCEAGRFSAVSMFEANLTLLPELASPLKDYAEVHLHMGTAEMMARVALLEDKQLQSGKSALVQFRLSQPLPVAAGERFIVRHNLSDQADGRLTTIGGGRVISCAGVRLRRQRDWILTPLREQLAALDDPKTRLELTLRRQVQPLSLHELAKLAAERAQELGPILDELIAGGIVITRDGKCIHKDVLAQAQQATLAALEAFHAAQPSRVGLTEAELRAQPKFEPATLAGCRGQPVVLAGHATTLAWVLDSLLLARKIERHGELYCLSGRGSQLHQEDREAIDRVEQAVRAAGLAPPLPEELANSLALPRATFDKLLGLLREQGKVVRLDEKVWMHREAVDQARGVVLRLFAGTKEFETVAFRDALGVSRKFAVPLLDYFDAQRLTVRHDNRRTPGAEARKLLAQAPAAKE